VARCTACSYTFVPFINIANGTRLVGAGGAACDLPAKKPIVSPQSLDRQKQKGRSIERPSCLQQSGISGFRSA
ncbi:hypothetical protein, partial [Pseudomonas asplenii]|uniref:hypothetical protein n=1 Tax=Pseudomonas asplenii TaxID=53407 RepID=UPI001E47689C